MKRLDFGRIESGGSRGAFAKSENPVNITGHLAGLIACDWPRWRFFDSPDNEFGRLVPQLSQLTRWPIIVLFGCCSSRFDPLASRTNFSLCLFKDQA